MEFTNDNNARRRLSEKEDQLSMLPDDLLLTILGRVGDLNTAVVTSMLSTRWRLLPWLLPELDIDVENYMSDPHSKPNQASDVHDAMLAITAAIKSLFSKPRRESTVARLQLKLFLIDTFSCDIGPLLCEAIDRGLLKNLDLAILDEKEPFKWSASDVLKRVQDMDGFFRAYPSVPHCLTTLSLYTLDFSQLDMDHILFDCCTQLKHLNLSFCHAGPAGLWKIDAPDSKLCVLELDRCWFKRVELISLPKLKKVNQFIWKFNDPPLSFGCVPSLEELELDHFLYPNQHSITLSELLHGAAGIHTLTLNFIGNTIWLRPEIKQLASAFSMLRKLFILGVFVQFDLMWTTAFLEAAPSIEILHIEVFEPCEKQYEYTPWLAHKRTNPQWDLDFRGSKNLVLRELRIVGFRPLQQQLTFIRAILDRAPNLQKVVLIKDDQKCDESSAILKNKEEQEMVVRQVTDGNKSFLGRVSFRSLKSCDRVNPHKLVEIIS